MIVALLITNHGAQISATDFGVQPITLSKWLRKAEVEYGVKPGATNDQVADLRGSFTAGLTVTRQTVVGHPNHRSELAGLR